MVLLIHTSRISYGGPYRLDVTSRSVDHIGVLLAPSPKLLSYGLRYVKCASSEQELADRWDTYSRRYIEEMRQCYSWQRWAWEAFLND